MHLFHLFIIHMIKNTENISYRQKNSPKDFFQNIEYKISYSQDMELQEDLDRGPERVLKQTRALLLSCASQLIFLLQLVVSSEPILRL